MRSSITVSLVLATVFVIGCSEAPQQRYEAAVEALQEAKTARADAAETVAARKKALARQKQKLEQANAYLAETNQHLQQAKAQLNKIVNDKILFRAVQQAMLNTERFSSAAISVGVKNRIVTLTGFVPDKSTQAAALDKARAFPGVRKVRDELKISSEDAGS